MHKDKTTRYFVRDIQTARNLSVKLLPCLDFLFEFIIFSTDVTQAYFQSAEEMCRDAYVEPCPEFEISPNQHRKLLKPWRGINDSDKYWGRRLKNHLEKGLRMKTSVNDAQFLFKRIKDELSGPSATFMDTFYSLELMHSVIKLNLWKVSSNIYRETMKNPICRCDDIFYT